MGPSRTLSASSRAESTASAPAISHINRGRPPAYLSAPAVHSLESVPDTHLEVRSGSCVVVKGALVEKLLVAAALAELMAAMPCVLRLQTLE